MTEVQHELTERSLPHDPAGWRPVADVVSVPRGCVTLDAGPLKAAFDRNVEYLLTSSSVDDILHFFRRRAGKETPPSPRAAATWWTAHLRGSFAGKFLGGAGASLRSVDHPELRARMEAVVEGIADCARPDGYCLPYDPSWLIMHEIGNYDRSMFTHGMVEAGLAGCEKAVTVLRRFADWLYRQPVLAKMAHLHHGYQGIIPFTRTYFSPAGRPADIQAVLAYYLHPDWLQWLLSGDERAIWKHYSSHNYELTAFEAYLDLYRATGDSRFQQAVDFAHARFRDRWIHPGAIMAITEGAKFPPGSYSINTPTGELCGSVFWAFLNQRLHCLDPDREDYTAQIERVLFNPLLANQDGSTGIRYHALLHGRKGPGTTINTCCEVQGTRLLGAIPEFIYSFAADGVYVNLFAPSTVRWRGRGGELVLQQHTTFPADGDVKIVCMSAQPVEARVRIRIPSWTRGDVSILVNGQPAVRSAPGRYVALDRQWRKGDTVTFTLPMRLEAQRYSGWDQVRDGERFSITRGPILMAVEGPLDTSARTPGSEGTGEFKDLQTVIAQPAANIETWTTPRNDGGWPAFDIAGSPRHRLVSYAAAKDTFTAFPLLGAPRIGPTDLDTPADPLVPDAACTWAELALDLGDGVEMRLAPIPAGRCVIGEEGWQGDTVPLREAIIEQPFWMGRVPVTQAQWRAVMGSNPSAFPGDNKPVEQVNYHDCLDFVKKLNARPALAGYRVALPTEEQWEYACRCGCGHIRNPGDRGADLGDFAWIFNDQHHDGGTRPVGEGFPNGWGLYDMLGNVLEWCSDSYHPQAYRDAADRDSTAAPPAEAIVLRGSSWHLWLPDTHYASRTCLPPDWRSPAAGLRVVLVKTGQ